MGSNIYSFWAKVENIVAKRLGKTVLKQEALLRLSLQELGFNDKAMKIEIDHINGVNYINEVCFPVVYPASFFAEADFLRKNTAKKYDYYFNGNMSVKGERERLMLPFKERGAVIIESDVGRSIFSKSKFNIEYYGGLAKSRFGLCPHQKHWSGPRETIWTYRFIECCMVGVIPVVFSETPLGCKFLSGFEYVHDNDLLAGDTKYSQSHANLNWELVSNRHSLTKDQLAEIV